MGHLRRGVLEAKFKFNIQFISKLTSTKASSRKSFCPLMFQRFKFRPSKWPFCSPGELSGFTRYYNLTKFVSTLFSFKIIGYFELKNLIILHNVYIVRIYIKKI